MSTERSLSQPPVTLVTIYDIEHPHAIGHGIKAGLTLIGAAAGAVLALAAGSPSANADTVDLSGFPHITDIGSPPLTLGIAPFFAGEAYTAPGFYTDLFHNVIGIVPVKVDTYDFPGVGPQSIDFLGYRSDYQYTIFDSNLEPLGLVGGDNFSEASTNSGLYNVFEDTPVFAPEASTATDNINDVLAYDPTGNPLYDLSGIEFGIQYLDLPFAATPVDEINLLGAGGEILASIPVTGDLFSLF